MSTIEHIDRNEGREKSMKQVRWELYLTLVLLKKKH
jgi:hypothetical protein